MSGLPPDPLTVYPRPPDAPEAWRDDVIPATRADLRFAAYLTVVLALLGAVLGLAWAAWSPPGPRALVLDKGQLQPDETESFVAADGRYLAIAAAVGLLAAIVVWFWRNRRGPLAAVGLLVGGLAGSLLMELTGHLTGGGTTDGKPGTIIAALPLSLHIDGLVVIEPALATLIYGILAAFAVSDDLDRPDPRRQQIQQDRAVPSVGAGDHAQHGGGHGDAAGVLQQRDLPPQ